MGEWYALCISQSLLNVENYGMPLRIYLRVSYISVACNALFTHGILVRFCPWLSSKSYSENRLIKDTPIVALHFSPLMFGEVCCPRACLDKPIISYLHHGLSQALIFNLLLVRLWTRLLDVCVTFLTSCVWEGHVLHLVSHLLKTMLMLNSHPYISLLKCFDVTHTHHFGCAYS